jgi:hypothetical protein
MGRKGTRVAVNNAAYGVLCTLDSSKAAFDGPLAVERKQAVRVRKEGTAGKSGENAPLTGGNEVLDGALSNGGTVDVLVSYHGESSKRAWGPTRRSKPNL